MPMTPAAFSAVQDTYKAAIAFAAGINPLNVDILSVSESRRRAGSSDVETKIRARDSAALKVLGDKLGSGDAALATINAELVKRGLPASTGVKTAVPATKEDRTNTLGIVLGVLLPVIFIGVAGFAYRKYLHNLETVKDTTPAGASLVMVASPSAPVHTFVDVDGTANDRDSPAIFSNTVPSITVEN
jgi:hypothetical protein